MEILPKLLSVFGLGIVEIWAAVPVGLAFGLNPVVTGILSALGGIAGISIILFAGQKLRDWLARRHGWGQSLRPGRLQRIWARYGVVGLGLLAPLLVGAPAGTALGVILGASARQLFLWMSAGVITWSAILVALGAAGISLLGHQTS